MLEVKKVIVLLLAVLSIIFIKKNLLDVEKNKNVELRNEVKSNEVGKINVDDKKKLENNGDSFKNRENKKDEVDNGLEDFKNKEKIRFFCEEISKYDSVKKIENNNSSYENSYTIVLNSSSNDFRKIMKKMDKAGFKILINKICYDKIKNQDEYSILVNIF